MLKNLLKFVAVFQKIKKYLLMPLLRYLFITWNTNDFEEFKCKLKNLSSHISAQFRI